MWCHLPTGFKRRYVLQFVALASMIVALITTLIFAHVAHAVPATNKTISFQGRLLTAAGAVVPDGHYNIQFKIYQDGAGTAAGNPGGSLKWTESYVNNGGDSGVEVRNGFFSVSLGSLTPFGSSVDWDQDTLFLSMNVAGSSAVCSAFGTAPCTADGEMLPMKRITATPYAINAGAVNGKTADNFVQLAQGVQTDASSNTSSIYINKTGTGNLIQLQDTGRDVFTVTNSGDLELGSGATRSISVGTAAGGSFGDNLVLRAGNGGDGTGSTGGTTIIQGGAAGGANGDGGAVAIEGGNGTGSGANGSIFIGSSNNSGVQIGNTNLASGMQTIVIGTNANSGGTSNVIIGSAATSGGGTTKIQSKDNTTIATNGVDRATFDTNGTLTLGNGVSSNTPTDFKIQGTSSSANGTSGGNLTVQGGGATTGNANGGNLTLSGGTATGTGAKGLVVIDTPTYASASVQTSGVNTTVTQANIDSFGVVTLNASTPNIGFTLGAPSLGASAAGRILYVTAANGSQQYTLRANVGGGAGVEQTIPMQQNTTATLIWNGALWTVAGSAGSTTLQSTYNNSVQSTGDATITTYGGTSSGNGLVVKDSATSPTTNSIMSVQSASSAPILSVSGATTNEIASNPGAETAGVTASQFPANTWSNRGIDQGGPGWWDAAVTRHTTPGDHIVSGDASVKVTTQNGWTGAANKLTSKLTPGVTYNVSMKVRTESVTLPHFSVYLFPAGDHDDEWAFCTDSITVTSTGWTNVNCTFQAPANVTDQNSIFMTAQDDLGVYYIDDFSVARTNPTSNVQVGGDAPGDESTLFTLDKSANRPTDGNNEALLGSMYYDTTLGKVQCFESEGWGACGASPDSFITLSPEYSNAVMHGSAAGTITSDLCSDALNINDGSSSQPTICGTNETNNFYKWTSPETTDQTRSIFVTYQLPTSFKEFVAGSTSLMGRTDSTNSAVSYQIYRNNSSGLTACGSVVSVSTGVKSTWQKTAASGTADPSTCDFNAGDNIVVRINLTAKDDANAYVSNLGFTFSNQ